MEEIPYDETSRYGSVTQRVRGVVEIIEKPDDPPSNLVQMSNRGEYELPDAIDLVIKSGRTIDAIRLDGWWIDVGFLEDRDYTEERLDDITDADIDDQKPMSK